MQTGYLSVSESWWACTLPSGTHASPLWILIANIARILDCLHFLIILVLLILLPFRDSKRANMVAHDGLKCLWHNIVYNIHLRFLAFETNAWMHMDGVFISRHSPNLPVEGTSWGRFGHIWWSDFLQAFPRDKVGGLNPPPIHALKACGWEKSSTSIIGAP